MVEHALLHWLALPIAFTMDGDAANGLVAQAAKAKKFAPDFWRYVLAAGFGAGSAWTTMLINQRVNEAEHTSFVRLMQVHEDRMGRIQNKLEGVGSDEAELRGRVDQLSKAVDRCAVKP